MERITTTQHQSLPKPTMFVMERRQCSGCQICLMKTAYSQTQWRKYQKRCLRCLDAAMCTPDKVSKRRQIRQRPNTFGDPAKAARLGFGSPGASASMHSAPASSNKRRGAANQTAQWSRQLIGELEVLIPPAVSTPVQILDPPVCNVAQNGQRKGSEGSAGRVSPAFEARTQMLRPYMQPLTNSAATATNTIDLASAC